MGDNQLTGKCPLLTPEGLDLIAPLGTSTTAGWFPFTQVPLLNETEDVQDKILEPMRFAPQAVQVMPMPAAGFVVDTFWAQSAALIPWCFILIFIYSVYMVASNFIVEKETKIRETLKMMGVTNGSIILSWYLTYAWIQLIVTLLLSIVLKLMLLKSVSFPLLALFFWLYTMSYVAYGYMIHVFFDKAMTGGIVGTLRGISSHFAFKTLTYKEFAYQALNNKEYSKVSLLCRVYMQSIPII